MKKTILLTAVLCMTAFSPVWGEDYEIRVLTFEDSDWKGGENMYGEANWSSLIDSQYGGSKLYGPSGYGYSNEAEVYTWRDENNTELSNTLSYAYGSWCYWSGGHAISNYGTANYSSYGDYTCQLTVFNGNGTEEITQKGHGHNGSDNFAVHFGYADNSGWSTGVDALPVLTFADGVARIVDHIWVTNTTYAMSCMFNGNGLTASISEDDWIKVVVEGFNNGESTGTIDIYLCNGPDNILTEWTKFDLYELGKVTSLRFNITGSSDNGYGFSQPAYFAYDDVAVRFETKDETTGNIFIEVDNTETPVYYDLMGRIVKNPTKGIYIVNGKKVIL